MICCTCNQDKGGNFRWRGGERWQCADCQRDYQRLDGAKNLWEFETLNIGKDPNAGPIKVTSLRHLRQLEREHGVQSVAANFDEGNWKR